MLLGWCVDDDQREPVVVDIDRDNLVPRIELQGTRLAICAGIIHFLQKNIIKYEKSILL